MLFGKAGCAANAEPAYVPQSRDYGAAGIEQRTQNWPIESGEAKESKAETHLLSLEISSLPAIIAVVSKLEQIEAELGKLSRAELLQIRNWLDDLLEDELEFTPEFEATIQKSERERAKGISPHVREV